MMSMAISSRLQEKKKKHSSKCKRSFGSLSNIYCSSLPKVKGSLQLTEIINQRAFSLQSILNIICIFITPNSTYVAKTFAAIPQPTSTLSPTTDLIESHAKLVHWESDGPARWSG